MGLEPTMPGACECGHQMFQHYRKWQKEACDKCGCSQYRPKGTTSAAHRTDNGEGESDAG